MNPTGAGVTQETFDMKLSFRLAMIGAGNMAEAILKGLTSPSARGLASLIVSDIRAERLSELEGRYPLRTTGSNREAVQDADVIVLAVKPQNVPDVAAGLAGHLPRGGLLISLVAGFRTDTIENRFGDGLRVVRVMPNTPAFVGAGVTAICAGQHALPQDVTRTERIFETVGQTVRIEESLLDAVTALSGSGPAYVCFLVEAMLEAAQRMGLPGAAARTLALATIAGTVKLLSETGQEPAEARARVTSKNGATEAALRVLAERGAREAWVAAIEASCARAAELGKGQ